MRWGQPTWAAVPMRIVVGIVLTVSGYGKLMGMAGNIANFTKWGFPIPEATAWFIALLEFSGGIALLLGLLVRYLGAIYTIEFIVAALWVKFPLAGYQQSRIDMFLIAGAAALFFLGAGPLSIDSVWLEKGKR
jgi:putative oxidoreductase